MYYLESNPGKREGFGREHGARRAGLPWESGSQGLVLVCFYMAWHPRGPALPSLGPAVGRAAPPSQVGVRVCLGSMCLSLRAATQPTAGFCWPSEAPSPCCAAWTEVRKCPIWFPSNKLMVVRCPASRHQTAQGQNAHPRLSVAMLYVHRKHSLAGGREQRVCSPFFDFPQAAGLSEQLTFCNKIGAGRPGFRGRAAGSAAGGEAGFCPLWGAAGHCEDENNCWDLASVSAAACWKTAGAKR